MWVQLQLADPSAAAGVLTTGPTTTKTAPYPARIPPSRGGMHSPWCQLKLDGCELPYSPMMKCTLRRRVRLRALRVPTTL